MTHIGTGTTITCCIEEQQIDLSISLEIDDYLYKFFRIFNNSNKGIL
jgi:hypothetical protein